jgi:hypothetical protein
MGIAVIVFNINPLSGHYQRNADRFNIKNTAVRANFIRSLYYLMEEVKKDIIVKFEKQFDEFNKEYEKISKNYDETLKTDKGQAIKEFRNDFTDLREKDEYKWVRNLFFWAREMNYISNIFINPQLLDKNDVDTILFEKNPESKEPYYFEYIVTAIYSIINKSLFIRILEDSSTKGSIQFLQGEKNGRYLSNGILSDKFLEGNLKRYISQLFKFTYKDLKKYDFLLKHDIYDWIIDEIEEHTLVSFLRTFNEIYLKELDQDILGDIYEHYLQEQTDERKGKSYRRLLGQYYTPRPIVRFMWYLVRDVLESEGRTLYKKGKEMLKVIDPFMGSGTFLNEGLLQMKSTDSGKEISQGEVFYFFKDRKKDRMIEHSITGFDINPLTCTIADINTYFRLIKSFSPKVLEDVPIKELQLYRTNSYDLEYTKDDLKSTIQLSLLDQEIRSSFAEPKKIIESKLEKYDVIIANPPYGKIKPNNYMKDELLPFAYPHNNYNSQGKVIPYTPRNSKKKSKVPKFEKNRGKIEDMYAFGYGVANKLITDNGIIVFITSNTILTLPSYKWLRKFFLENYTICYIVNFNRVMEKSNSMFSPESAIATSIIVMIKKKSDLHHYVKYLDLSNIDSIKGKYDAFNEVSWKEKMVNKNDIETFRTKKIRELKFENIFQHDFLENFDYEYIELNPLITKIEKDTTILTDWGILNCGISTANDTIFIANDKHDLEIKITEFTKEFDYEFSEENIKEYIFSKLVVNYGVEEIKYIYYDNTLLNILKNECKKSGSSYNARFGDESKLTNKLKLIITAHHFYVDDEGRYPSLNCIDGKNTYYLISKEDELYYICGILNSKLGLYYRLKTQIDNYERFPIKKIKGNKKLVNEIASKSKYVHQLKADYRKFKIGDTTFDSKFFLDEIKNNLEVFPIDEKNEHFELEIPKGFGTSHLIDEPKIDTGKPKTIILNKDGLKLNCKTDDIAIMIYETYIKNEYGDLNELDICISITQMDKTKIQQLVEKIDKEIIFVAREIDLLVYVLYFQIDAVLKNGHIQNESEILKNSNVKEIEAYLTKIGTLL